MSKLVRVPDCMDPFVVTVNGKKHMYKAGEIVTVPEEVAEVIAAHYETETHHSTGAILGGQSQYFQITLDGVLSLKPVYRGAPTSSGAPEAAISDMGLGKPGSKHDALPEHLVIPEIVGDVAVNSLAVGIFCGNKVIRTVTLPKTITEIPKSCFNGSLVEEVFNVEQITTLGAGAFMNSNIKSVWLPNLTELGASAFCQCSHLTHVHIGKVTQIDYDTFYKCRYLSRVESAGLVTSVGDCAFLNTNRLVNANLPVGMLQTLGKTAFACTGWDADWNLLPSGGTKGANATCQQYNATDFWSDLPVVPCENPIPTLLCQLDPRWINKPILIDGEALTPQGKPCSWGACCLLFCMLHAYCGFNGLRLSHVDEFEAIVESIAPGHINTYGNDHNDDDIPNFCRPLGMIATNYSGFNQEHLQLVYQALAEGKYIVFQTSIGTAGKMTGHAVLGYGITQDGKIMIADSDYRSYHDRTSGAVYALPYKTLTAATSKFSIIEKER